MKSTNWALSQQLKLVIIQSNLQHKIQPQSRFWVLAWPPNMILASFSFSIVCPCLILRKVDSCNAYAFLACILLYIVHALYNFPVRQCSTINIQFQSFPNSQIFLDNHQIKVISSCIKENCLDLLRNCKNKMIQHGNLAQNCIKLVVQSESNRPLNGLIDRNIKLTGKKISIADEMWMGC